MVRRYRIKRQTNTALSNDANVSRGAALYTHAHTYSSGIDRM